MGPVAGGAFDLIGINYAPLSPSAYAPGLLIGLIQDHRDILGHIKLLARDLRAHTVPYTTCTALILIILLRSMVYVVYSIVKSGASISTCRVGL